MPEVSCPKPSAARRFGLAFWSGMKATAPVMLPFGLVWWPLQAHLDGAPWPVVAILAGLGLSIGLIGVIGTATAVGLADLIFGFQPAPNLPRAGPWIYDTRAAVGGRSYGWLFLSTGWLIYVPGAYRMTGRWEKHEEEIYVPLEEIAAIERQRRWLVYTDRVLIRRRSGDEELFTVAFRPWRFVDRLRAAAEAAAGQIGASPTAAAVGSSSC